MRKFFLLFILTFLSLSSFSATYYWVGGSGTWDNSTTTNWSLSSGGVGGAGYPTSSDDVIFDANSFTAGSKTVTMGGFFTTMICRSVTWSAATNTPTWDFNTNYAELDVYGDFTLISAMTLSVSSSSSFNFKSTSTGKTITTASKTLCDVNFSGTGGGWTFQDNFSVGTNEINHSAGTLNTNGYTVTCSSFDASGSTTRTLTLGASTINISGSFLYDEFTLAGSNITVNGGTSTINITGSGGTYSEYPVYVYLNGKTIYNLAFSSGLANNIINLYDSGTVNNLTFNSNQIVIFESGSTITVNGTLSASAADCSSFINIFSSTAGSATTLSTGSAQNISYVAMKDITKSGLGSITCTSCVDGGSNTSVTFASSNTSRNLYWIGSSGTGNSGTGSNWSTNSNGTSSGNTCVPTIADNIYFNASSFPSSGKTFTINKPLVCASMDWTGTANSPTLTNTSSYYPIILTGNLTLAAGIGTFNHHGPTYFVGSGTQAVTCSGFTLGSSSYGTTYITGGGTVKLESDLNLGGDLEIENGTLNVNNVAGSNSYDITIGGDWDRNTSTGTFTYGTKTVTFNGSSDAYLMNDETFYNLTLNKSTSAKYLELFYNATVNNNLTVNVGTLDVYFSTLTVTGISDINSILKSDYSATIDANGTFDATGGSVTFGGSASLNIGGATVTSLGTFTCGSSTVTYDYAGNQNVIAATYYKLTMASSGTKTAQGTVNVGNNFTLNGTTTYAVGTTTTTVTGTSDINTTLTVSTGTFDANGTFDATGGSVTFTGAGNLYLGSTVTSIGTFTESTSTVTYDGTAQSVRADTYYNLTLAGSGNKTPSGTINVSNNFTENGTATYAIGTTTTNVTGATDINSTVTISTGTLDTDGSFDATGGTITFSGAGNLYLSGATITSLGTFTESTSTVTYDYAGSQNVIADDYYNLVIATSGTKTAQGTINVTNNLTNNGTSTYAVAATTTTVTGTSDINNALTISTGTFDANGTFDATGGAVTFTGAGNLYLSSTVTSIGTFTESTSTVTFDGASQSVPSDTYYNLTLAGSGTKTPGGTVNVSNNFTENGTATYAIGTTTTNVTGATDINSTVTISTGTLDANGSFDATGGAITFSGAGNLYLSGATITSLGTFTESTSTVTYDYAGSQNVIADDYYNLVIATSGTKTAQGTINVGNNLTNNGTSTYAVGTTTTTVTGTSDINNALTLSTGTFDANGTFDATGGAVTFTGAGSLYLSGATVTSLGTFTPSTGSVYYDRGGAQTVLSTTYNNLFIATSGTKTLGGAIVTTGNLQISAGTLDVSGSNYGISCAGNWTNNGTFTGQSGTVEFNGGTAQTLGGSASTSFYNLTMSNSSITGVTLGVNTTISNQLTLSDGLLYTASYTLTLGTTSTNATVPIGSSNSYIVAYDNSGTIGYVKQYTNSNTTYNYPIGDATYYSPATFQLTANGGLTAAYFIMNVKDAAVSGLKTGTLTTYLTRQWVGTQSGMTTPTYTITLKYDNTDIIGTETDLLPIKYSGGTWYGPTGSSFITSNLAVPTTLTGTGSVDAASNTLTWSGLTTFSIYGGAGNQASVLPVELLSFDVYKNNRTVNLNWVTATEKNSAYFQIERAKDGINFEPIGTTLAAGNSTNLISYLFIDQEPLIGVSYYRLKQVDLDGSFIYSSIKSIYTDYSTYTIYPNPASSNKLSARIQSETTTNAVVSLVDELGHIIYSKSMDLNIGENIIELTDLNVSTGLYTFRLQSNLMNISEKVVFNK